MALGQIHPGYRGLADIGTIGQVRFGDASISAKQGVRIDDVIMGDFDHDAYNYDKIEVGGSISGPVTETFISGSAGGGLWDWGAKRYGDCGDLIGDTVKLWYYCGGTEPNYREFTGMFVNNLGFSCAAGDIAQFTMDLMGITAGPWSNQVPPSFTTAEKFITWDKVTLTMTPGDEDFVVPANVAYSNFDFTIANGLTAMYALNQPNLFPFDIVPSLRSITGSVSIYNTPQANGVDRWDDYIAANIGTITFNIGTLAITMKVRFHRVEPASTVGAVISTLGFTGTGPQLGVEWRG